MKESQIYHIFSIDKITFFITESPVSIKMRIRHYFSHLSINSSASYDVRQGFDKQFCVDFIEDCDPNNTRRCQTAPRKPGRPSLGSGGQQQLTHQNSSTQTRSASVPALVTEKAAQVMIFSVATYENILLCWQH